MVLAQTMEPIQKTYLKLSEILPLKTPLTLMIDPSNKCNFRCAFCPTGDYDLLQKVRRPQGTMNFNLYSKVIDDLTAFPEKIKSLRLYKDGEPFLNKNIVPMIQYAKEKEVADEIYIISNGSLITEKVAVEIIDAGLGRLRISIEHVNNEKYKELTGNFSNYEQVVKNVKFLFKEKQKRKSGLHIDVKIIDTGLSKEDFKKFQNDFSSIADSLTVETLMGWSMSSTKDWTLGKKPQTGIDGKSELKNIQVCPEPFKGLAVNFDGTVSVCCVDWSHGTIVGDLKKESLYEVWNGPKLRKFRTLHLMKQKQKIPVCSKCQYIKGHHSFSHLDEDADFLLQKFAQSNGASSDANLNEIDYSWTYPA